MQLSLSVRPLLRLFLLVLCALSVAVVVVGCGGGNKAKFAGATAVCGTTYPNPPSYQPTGKIVADSGFRPETDGFDAENYGNCGQTNMTAGAMSNLFGSDVCVSGSGADCSLYPAAQKWMDTTNSQMAGGHCMGFSVTALRFFSGNLNPSDFGADTTVDLDVKGNRDLQALIAANWVYQFLPTVTGKELTGPPNAILQAIGDSLNNASKSNRSSAYPSSGNLYTIKIFNSEGGHAVTPYAVEDKGGGKYAVLIYDNNYPGITRAIAFDTNANTWSYNAATKPGNPESLYTGDAANPTNMRLDPTGPGETTPQQFNFVSAPNAGSAGSTGSTATPTNYNQISLVGNPANHAHLLLKDSKGRETGFVFGEIVNHIPGVQVQQIAANFDWAQTPEPNYLVPAKGRISVFIDGSNLDKPDTETLTLIGRGFYTEVSDLKLNPGQTDFVYFTGDGKGFVYRTAPNHNQSPTVASAIQKGNGAYAFAAKAVGVKGGSQITMYIEPRGAFVLDTTGTKGAIKRTGGYAVYALSLVHVTPQGELTWVNGKTPILLKSGWQAIIDFTKAPTPGKKVVVQTGPAKGKSPIPIQFLEPQK